MRKKQKQTRNTQIKAIAAEPGSIGKLGAAVGANMTYDMERPRDDREVAAIITDAKWLDQNLEIYSNSGEQAAALFQQQAAKITSYVGWQVIDAIVEKDWVFLSKLAAAVQHGKEPQKHDIAETILKFCHFNNCGTKELPCDAAALEKHLENAGTRYKSTDYDNQVPRGLRAICQRLGVVLARKD